MTEFVEMLSKLDRSFLSGLALFIIIALHCLSDFFPIVITKNIYKDNKEPKNK